MVLLDEVGRPLGDHVGGRVGVRRGDLGHDGSVHDPQPLDAAHAEARVHHGVGVGAGPHFARPRLVVDREGQVPDVAPPVLPAPERVLPAARQRDVVQARIELPHGLGLADLDRLEDAVHEDLQVVGDVEVVVVDERLPQGVPVPEHDAALALGPHQHGQHHPRVVRVHGRVHGIVQIISDSEVVL